MQEGSTAVALAMVTPGYDQDPASGVADYTTHQDQAQFEADKRAVYKHPLFPLLALLFERCEQATQSSDNSTSESFNMDIQAFVQHQERDRKPFLINDPEIDGLVSLLNNLILKYLYYNLHLYCNCNSMKKFLKIEFKAITIIKFFKRKIENRVKRSLDIKILRY